MLSLRLRKKNQVPAQEEGHERAIGRSLWKTNVIERELFVVCLLVFGASMASSVSTQDGIHFALTSSLAFSRTIWLDSATFSGQAYTVQLGAHTYSALPPGLAFFTFAAVSIGQFLTPQAPSASGVYIATYFSPIFGAIAAVLFYKTARMFGSEKSSAFLTIIFAFGTSLWIYSRIYLPEALATCLGLAAVYCVLRAQQLALLGNEETHAKHLGEYGTESWLKNRKAVLFAFLSGALLGIAVFVDNVAIFLIVPTSIYLTFFSIRSSGKSNRALGIISFVGGTLLGLIPTWTYDIATTGNALSSPYGNPFIGGVSLSSYSFNFLGHGLYELLLSPGNGLLLFTPFAFVSLIALYYMIQESLADAILFLALFVSILLPISLVNSSTYFLQSPIGSSELVIAMPYILLPAVSLLNRTKKTLSLVSLLSYVLGASSIVITGVIALTDPVLGLAAALSGSNNSSPLLTTNIPLFLHQSFLTWWSFFTDPIIYATLVLIFPLLILSYWMFADPGIITKSSNEDHDEATPVELVAQTVRES
jgi:4-amino-4-deoxy-L-arabinose transferase-like glycosyltransferase